MGVDPWGGAIAPNKNFWGKTNFLPPKHQNVPSSDPCPSAFHASMPCFRAFGSPILHHSSTK